MAHVAKKKRSTHGYRLSLGLLNGSIKLVAQGERSQFGGPANVVQTSAHVKTVRFLSNTNKKKGDKTKHFIIVMELQNLGSII